MMKTPPPFYPIATDAKERDCVSEILSKQLYISNWRGAASAALLGVTHIAAIGEEFTEDVQQGIIYYHKDITDDPDSANVMEASLREVASFIDQAISKKNGRVLVHCAAGCAKIQ